MGNSDSGKDKINGLSVNGTGQKDYWDVNVRYDGFSEESVIATYSAELDAKQDGSTLQVSGPIPVAKVGDDGLILSADKGWLQPRTTLSFQLLARYRPDTLDPSSWDTSGGSYDLVRCQGEKGTLSYFEAFAMARDDSGTWMVSGKSWNGDPISFSTEACGLGPNYDESDPQNPKVLTFAIVVFPSNVIAGSLDGHYTYTLRATNKKELAAYDADHGKRLKDYGGIGIAGLIFLILAFVLI
jgi:hypothetical protein